MTDYYVGKGGSNSENGTTWALRRLTIPSAESLLSAGDTLYIGPGTYRLYTILPEPGTLGNEIVHWGDITGEHTDGIGGVVRVTGMANDSDAAPNNSAYSLWPCGNYREFYNIAFDHARAGVSSCMYSYAKTGILFENCVFGNYHSDSVSSPRTLWAGGSTGQHTTARNCIFIGLAFTNGAVYFNSTSADRSSPSIIENCLLYRATAYFNDHHGITVRNCTLIGQGNGIWGSQWDAGENFYIYQNMFLNNNDDVLPGAAIINNDYNVSLDATLNGANTINSVPYFEKPIFLNGFKFPDFNFYFRLSNRTAVTINGDTSAPDFDLFNLPRPASGKKTPGALQYRMPTRETTTVFSGSSSSQLPDAGRFVYQAILKESVSHTISVMVYREANYTGTLPQMVIRRVGQSDITVTDTGSAGQWNTLIHTFTAGADDKYAQIEFVSNNTATSGDYKVNFDRFLIKSKDRETKRFLTDVLHISNFNKKPVEDVWITPSTPVLSPTVDTFRSHRPPYIN